MGLEKIHAITKAGGYVLKMTFADWTGDVAGVQLPFRLGGRDSKYSLWVQKDEPLSPLETSLGTDASAGLPFSTHDQDNDQKSDINCAKQLSGESEFHQSDEVEPAGGVLTCCFNPNRRLVVQQLRTLQPERQILPESTAQAAAPEEAGHLLEVLAWPLLPSEEQRDDDRSRCRPKTILRRARVTQRN